MAGVLFPRGSGSKGDPGNYNDGSPGDDTGSTGLTKAAHPVLQARYAERGERR